MPRGQGSLEYLLILAAILALAVIVVLIANMMLGSPRETNIVTQDKYNFAVRGAELRGYERPIDPGDACGTAPELIVVDGEEYGCADPAAPSWAELIGELHDSQGGSYPVHVEDGEFFIDHGQAAEYFLAAQQPNYNSLGSNNGCYQTFKPTISGRIGKIVLRLSNLGVPVSVMATLKNNAGTVLATMGPVTVASDSYYVFDSPSDDALLATGSTYQISIGPTSVKIGKLTTDPYPEGSWSCQPSADAYFEVYVT